MRKGVAAVEKRISYLFQLAHLCITSKDVDKDMCRYHVRNLKRISKKNVIRLHPDIKRKLCKHCDLLLYAGITAKVRVSKRPQRAINVQCIECKSVKKYPCTNPEYKLWIEKCQDGKE
ncbi:ribonuclease P protein subunit p21-like [Crassostrea virginica]